MTRVQLIWTMESLQHLLFLFVNASWMFECGATEGVQLKLSVFSLEFLRPHDCVKAALVTGEDSHLQTLGAGFDVQYR